MIKNTQRTYTTEPARMKIARILAVLEAAPADAYTVAEKISCVTESARRYLWHMHSQELIHVAAWRTDVGGPRRPIFGAGNGPDAKRPRALTNAEQQRAYRRHVRKDRPDRQMQILAKKRGYRIQPRRDPMIEAMYGRADA